MQKIVSMMLSLTIVSGLVTPVYAADASGIDSGEVQTIKLEDIIDTDNIDLEYDDQLTDLEYENNYEEETSESEEDSEAGDSQNRDISENEYKVDEVYEKPSYSLDEEMEKYLEEYLNSLNKNEGNIENEYILSNSEEEETIPEMEYEDGIYYIDYSTNEITSNNLSTYIDSNKSMVEIVNGKIKVCLAINESEAIADVRVKVNGKPAAVKRTEIDDRSYIVEFTVKSLNDAINLIFDCDYSTVFKGMDIQSHEVELLINDIELVEEESEVMTLAQSIEEGIYSVDYSVYKDGTFQESTLKKYITDTVLKAEKNKKKLILNIDNSSGMIGNLTAKVNSNAVEVSTSEKDGVITMEFEIESIEDEISLGMSVTTPMMVMNHNVDFVINGTEFVEELTETEEEIQKDELKEGLYSVDYSVYKEGTLQESTLKKYITDTELKAEKNKKKLILNIDNSSGMIGNLTAKVNSNAVEVSTSEKDSVITMEFEIESIEDEISLGMSVTTPMMVMNHNVDFIVNDITYLRELTEDDNKIEDENDSVENEEDSTEENKTLKDGIYTIESRFLKYNSISEESAAGNYLNSRSTLTVKEGKYILTINVKSYADAFSDLSAVVDDTAADDVEFVKNSDGTGSISFGINSLNSSISVGCTLYIAAINYTNATNFDVKLDTATIKDENGNEIEAPQEDILNINKDAVYTISNKVIAGENGSIPECARYLETSSSVEVKYGNIFVTLVFNMTGFMDGRSITLNDNQSASTAAVKTQNNKTYVSFMINSLSDEIHISGKSTKSMDDSFTLVLDSSTLVENTAAESSSSSSSSSTADDDDDDDDLDNGTYTIKNKVLKEDSDSESHARDYVDKESIITVKNNKMYLTLKFVKASVIKGVSIKVDGTKTSYSTVKKTSDKLYIKFRIDSLSDEILVTTDLDLSNYGIASHDGLAFRVLLRSSTLEEDDDADNYDDEDDDDEEESEEKKDNNNNDEKVTDTATAANGEINNLQSNVMNTAAAGVNNSYKKTTYKVNNEIITESSFGYQAARGAVNPVGYYEIIDDKKYITLGFSQTDIMNNIRLSVDGKQINYDIISQDNSKNTVEIRFEVPSISTVVTVTTNVTAMGRDISFGIQFLESTLELISVEESDNLSDLTAGSSSTSSLSGSGSYDSSAGGIISKIASAFSSGKDEEGGIIADEEASEDLTSIAKEYFKKYTVTNEVISDSTIGRSMARKYLNQTSIIEDIDGQLYATVTFSSASSMGDFRIEVNGETVSHTVPLKDMSNDLISLRFHINSVNDDIRAYMYINAMRMNINFGIRFLEDSMILIEEGTIGEEGDAEFSSLADTLSDVNESSQADKEQVSAVKIAASTSVMMVLLNQVLSGLGIVFRRFKTKSILRKVVSKE